MSKPLSVADFFVYLDGRVSLNWLTQERDSGLMLDGAEPQVAGGCLIGYLNGVRISQIGLIGAVEMAYLDSLSNQARTDLFKALVAGRARVLIVCDALALSAGLHQLCHQYGLGLMTSRATSDALFSEIQHLFFDLFADQTVLHGVFMEVVGMGVLLVGDAGTGKSELALELVTRGHRLIADDAPLFSRISPTVLSGSCPQVLQDFLEVRGLGLLNIRAMYGDSAIKKKKHLRLIVNLTPFAKVDSGGLSRLVGVEKTRKVLGVVVPEVALPVAAGRNLAVLVEAAARHFLLKTGGYHSAEDFQRRLSQQLGTEES